MLSKIFTVFILCLIMTVSAVANEVYGNKYEETFYGWKIAHNNKYVARENEESLDVKDLLTDTNKLSFTYETLTKDWTGQYYFTNNLDYFVITYRDKVEVYNINSKSLIWSFQFDFEKINAPTVLISPNDKNIAITHGLIVDVLKLADGSHIQTISDADKLVFSPDDNILMFIKSRIHDVETFVEFNFCDLKNKNYLKGFALQTSSLEAEQAQFSKDSKSIYAIVSTWDNGSKNIYEHGLFKFDIKTSRKKLISADTSHDGGEFFEGFKFSPDENEVVIYTGFNHIHWYQKNRFNDFKSKEIIRFSGTSMPNSTPFFFLPNNLVLYTLSNWEIVIKNKNTNEIVQTLLTKPNEQIISMEMTDNGTFLSLGIYNSSIKKKMVYKRTID